MQKDHARLLDAWKRVKDNRKAHGQPPLLQKDLAHKYGVSESLIGHYLHGREPLNLKWQIRFAEFLEIPILELWPDFQHKQALNSGLPAAALEFALDYIEINDDGQEALRKMMAALPRRQPHKRDSK